MKSFKVLLFLIFIIFLVFWIFSISEKQMEDYYYAMLVMGPQRRALVLPSNNQRPELKLNAEAAIITRISTSGQERILYQKEINRGLPIASLTKLMTAIVITENCNSDTNCSLADSMKISQKAASQGDVFYQGNLFVNQNKTIEDLLDLMLTYSSNDAAFALSEVIGEKEFIDKMNEKAEELDLQNTQFVNPTGLDPQDKKIPNYSTAQDLVKITRYILENHPSLLETTLKNKELRIPNSFSDLQLNENQELMGGKTGYTFSAGGCLLTVTKNEKNQIFINIILGAKSPQERVQEMQKIIHWIN